MCLASNCRPSIEHARYNCGINFWCIAFHNWRPVHHRDTCQTHGVLQCDPFASQRAIHRAFYIGFHIPSIQWIFRKIWEPPRRAWISNWWQIVRCCIQAVIGLDVGLHDLVVFSQFCVCQTHTEFFSHIAHLRKGGAFDGHISHRWLKLGSWKQSWP